MDSFIVHLLVFFLSLVLTVLIIWSFPMYIYIFYLFIFCCCFAVVLFIVSTSFKSCSYLLNCFLIFVLFSTICNSMLLLIYLCDFFFFNYLFFFFIVIKLLVTAWCFHESKFFVYVMCRSMVAVNRLKISAVAVGRMSAFT